MTREWIYGRNPVFEVLRAERRQIFRLLVVDGIQVKGQLAKILDMCHQKKVLVETAPRTALDQIQPGNQGLLLETSAYPYATLLDMFECYERRLESPLILVLDSLQDPQNFGTLLRTAEVVGVHGVLLPLRRTTTVTPAVVNASSGATEHLLITQLNLAQAIQKLKDQDIWVIGLDSSTHAEKLDKKSLRGPLALVIGAEGQGIRPLVRKSCDHLLQLPMRGNIESLNAAVAGSIALYMAWEMRGYS